MIYFVVFGVVCIIYAWITSDRYLDPTWEYVDWYDVDDPIN
jgi:hypothetical protein